MSPIKSILLAEDSHEDAELTLAAFAEIKIANQVVVVKDGVEALEYLRCENKFQSREKELPAVLLLDIKMPRMSGIEVLQAVRSDPGLKHLPVVMLTSSREEPDLKKCYELGVNAYVVKPVNISDFIHSVKHLGVFWALINELPYNGG
jgi:CheY-like chemotaxis protein